jgi:MoaA/NifB/PqqE/SkfB family radical SAM enzyme
MLEKQIIPLSNIKSMHIMLGLKCNHRCKMCFQKNYSEEIDPFIYKEKLLPIYPYLTWVLLQGGEPTILPQTKEIIEVILKNNHQVKFAMMTNGHRFDEYWINQFIEHGDEVNFSLNAASSKTYKTITEYGDWDRTISNLKELIRFRESEKSSLKVMASFVIIEDNVHELSEFIKFCKELGLDKIRFFFDIEQLPRNKKLIRKELERAYEFEDINIEGLKGFESYVKKPEPLSLDSQPSDGNGIKSLLNQHQRLLRPCAGPFNHIAIETNGDVKLCCMTDKRLGNLHNQSIEELWNNMEGKRFRKLFEEKYYRKAGCNVKCFEDIG